jgi:integrase
MGKNLKGKELGLGISQREDGYYVGRYTNKYGRRVQKLFLKLQECRQWLRISR